MRSFFRQLPTFILFASILTLMSCNKEGKATSFFDTEETNEQDSLSLRVAVLPTQECNLLKFAQESGIAQSMGLDMKLIHYDALMDIDTAITSGVAHVYFEDSLRINRIKEDSIRPLMLLPIPMKMTLIANNEKDIKDIKGLGTNMVGLTRWSQLETWMNEVADSAKLCETDIYHAQINSIALRYKMVNGGLIDAGIFPKPWSDSLIAKGHIVLKEKVLEGMGFFISPSAQQDSLRQRQAALLKKVYLEALQKAQQ